MTKETEDFSSSSKCAMVIYPDLRERSRSSCNPEARLKETIGLALAIKLKIVHSSVLHLREIRPSILFGQGQVSLLKSYVAEKDVDLLIVGSSLTPVQQRNLEKALRCKVIDRTALILEIFGTRARTAEGRLQVELAALMYQRSRLVRSWTHLERQRGGLGFIGGPGETQLEMDRRLISQRIIKLKEELEDVKRTRSLHRQARKRVPYAVVALVGYTNAGKSTLFNRLTRADVFAEDLLFATLDPTMRLVKLPSGKEIILSDTVGFISDLPTQLIASFRATLEEVLEADLIVHVRDISHTETLNQKQEVIKVLEELELSEALEKNFIEVLNKIDLISEPVQALFISPDSIPLSALTGQGVEVLLKRIEEKLGEQHRIAEILVPLSAGEKLAWFYQHGEVLSRRDEKDGIHLSVRLSPENWMRYRKIKLH